jgi:hypothetical protein
MFGPPSRARARLHGHLWLLVLTPSSHWSGPAVWDRTGRVGACNCRPAARRSPRRQVASWQCGSAGRGCLRVGKWCDIGRGQPHQYLKRRDGHHKKRFLGVFGAAGDISNAPIRLHLVCVPRASRRDNWRLHPCKQRDGSARLSAKRKRRHLRTHCWRD